uniref:Membrane protein n=1 Tax=Pithovirus LCPAC406 TaxID=2506599 RepID=A0A481ZFT5_9VIRU|nr:MAG: membrane protein [Pithovirus LCPAC406]
MHNAHVFWIILALVIILIIAAIVVWQTAFSTRKKCEMNESPVYCYVYVCPLGEPATRLDGNGNIVQSGQGILDPNLFKE